jgi:hypothetical protein
MNWYPTLSTDVKTVDNYIAGSVYREVSTQGEGIDLRLEMHWLLYGKESFPMRVPKGHWVVYRRYDRSQKSLQYSERTQEGVGGPAFKYTDTLLRTRRLPTDRSGLPLDPTKVGLDISDKYIYYFEYTVVPAIGDHIFELVWDDHAKTPTLNTSLLYKDRYQVKRVHDYRLENGNVQYYITSCQYDEMSY